MTATTKTSLFLGDLAIFCTEEEISRAFESFGKIEEVKIMRSEETSRNLSYGFIRFATTEDATRALNEMNGFVLCGRPMRINWAAYKSKQDTPVASKGSAKTDELETSAVHVTFISYQTTKLITEESLRTLYSKYGNVIDVSIKKSMIDKDLVRQSGYGFVHYDLSKDGICSAVEAAKELTDTTIDEVNYKSSISHNLKKYITDELDDKESSSPTGGSNGNAPGAWEERVRKDSDLGNHAKSSPSGKPPSGPPSQSQATSSGKFAATQPHGQSAHTGFAHGNNSYGRQDNAAKGGQGNGGRHSNYLYNDQGSRNPNASGNMPSGFSQSMHDTSLNNHSPSVEYHSTLQIQASYPGQAMMNPPPGMMLPPHANNMYPMPQQSMHMQMGNVPPPLVHPGIPPPQSVGPTSHQGPAYVPMGSHPMFLAAPAPTSIGSQGSPQMMYAPSPAAHWMTSPQSPSRSLSSDSYVQELGTYFVNNLLSPPQQHGQVSQQHPQGYSGYYHQQSSPLVYSGGPLYPTVMVNPDGSPASAFQASMSHPLMAPPAPQVYGGGDILQRREMAKNSSAVRREGGGTRARSSTTLQSLMTETTRAPTSYGGARGRTNSQGQASDLQHHQDEQHR